MVWRRSAWLGPLLWVVAATSLDVLGASDDAATARTWDAVVVAGCRVEPGGTPSPPLRARVELAVDLWRRGAAEHVVFTGGVGTHPPAEGQVAADYAVSLGLPPEAVVLEVESTSTEGNAAGVAAMDRFDDVLVVTDRYHVVRAARVFDRYFDDVGGAGAASPWWYRATGALREVVALSWYAVRGRL